MALVALPTVPTPVRRRRGLLDGFGVLAKSLTEEPRLTWVEFLEEYAVAGRPGEATGEAADASSFYTAVHLDGEKISVGDAVYLWPNPGLAHCGLGRVNALGRDALGRPFARLYYYWRPDWLSGLPLGDEESESEIHPTREVRQNSCRQQGHQSRWCAGPFPYRSTVCATGVQGLAPTHDPARRRVRRGAPYREGRAGWREHTCEPGGGGGIGGASLHEQ